MIDRGEAVRRLALNVARYTGIAPLAAPYFSGVGAIFMLHRVNGEPVRPLGVNRHLTITPDFLDAVLGDLKRAGYDLVSLDEALERLRQQRCGRFVAITADDAYRDIKTGALPVLKAHDAPLTLYVAPALVSRTVDLWWDVLEEIVTGSDRVVLDTERGPVTLDCSTPARKFRANVRIHNHLTEVVREEERQPILRDMARRAGVDIEAQAGATLMDWEEVREVAAHPLVTIGAHSVSHYNLRRLDDEAAYREIADAARIVGFQTGHKPRHMAYPYGYESAVGAREVRMAREAGYLSAVTTRHGVLQRQHADHLHALPRISLNGRYQDPVHIRTMLSGITTALANAGRRVVTI